MPPTSTTRAGFSLVEVVIAIGIFAGAIAAILALFGPLSRSVGEVTGAGQAARLAEAINVELLRLRDAYPSGGATKNDQFAPVFANGAALTLVGSADGTRVVREADAGNDPVTANPRGIAPAERYFLIRVTALPGFTPGQTPFLALTATVQWPYRTPDGNGGSVVTAEASRRSLLLNYALPP